ncbi:hypothetical protein BH11BAC2_BH11BAC2_00350 [soil metagenome]
MKKIYSLIASLFLLTSGAYAQSPWVIQNVGYVRPSNYPFDIDIVDASTVWTCAFPGDGSGEGIQEFSTTNDGGNTWTAGFVTLDTNYRFAGIKGLSTSTAFALMYNNSVGGGALFKTIDSGLNWGKVDSTQLFVDPASFPDVIHFWDAAHGVIMGDPIGGYFEIYTTLDSGSTWTRVPQANIANPVAGEYGIVNDFCVNDSTMWFGTNKGRIYKSIDGGQNWTASTVVANVSTVSGIAFRDSLNGLAVKSTTAGVNSFYSTSNGGTSWTAKTYTGTLFFSSLVSVPGTSTYYSAGGGTGGRGSSYSINDGSNWILVDTAGNGTTQGYTSIEFLNNLIGWAGSFAVDQFTDGIYTYAGAAVGLTEPVGISLNNSISAYPNPTQGLVYLNSGEEVNGLAIVSVYDFIGKQVFQQQMNINKMVPVMLDIRKFKAGVYSVKVEVNQQSFVTRIIKN